MKIISDLSTGFNSNTESKMEYKSGLDFFDFSKK